MLIKSYTCTVFKIRLHRNISAYVSHVSSISCCFITVKPKTVLLPETFEGHTKTINYNKQVKFQPRGEREIHTYIYIYIQVCMYLFAYQIDPQRFQFEESCLGGAVVFSALVTFTLSHFASKAFLDPPYILNTDY